MRRIILTTLVSASALGLAQTAAATPVNFALGDSITFGETDLQYVKSLGDRGYPADYADYLGKTTGTRPKVVNLAIDGETAASFMSGSGRTPPVKGRTDRPLAVENLHYNPKNLVPQGQLFRSKVASARAAGNTIKNVSLTLGFNELGALAAKPKSQALAQVGPTLAAYKQSYSAVLSEIRNQTPNANLFLLNYYNPFTVDPSSPAAPIFAAGGAKLNDIIKKMAARYGAFYVDTADPFKGHIADYTFQAQLPAGSSVSGPFGGTLPIGDVHPNAKGYQVIAQALINARGATAVPEPSGLGLLGLGVALIAGSLWQRRRRGYARPY